MKTIFYKRKVKKLLGVLETTLKTLEKSYKYIKYSSIAEKSDIWVEIKKYKFAIEQLKSIL